MGAHAPPRSERAPIVSACYFILIENENVISLPTKMLAATSTATAAAALAALASNEKRARKCRKVCLKITKAAQLPSPELCLGCGNN